MTPYYFWLGREGEVRHFGITLEGGADMQRYREALGEILLARYEKLAAQMLNEPFEKGD